MKIKLIILVLAAFASSISYGNVENNNIYFHPVKEIFVDELPESIVGLDLIDSMCKLPVVFRGAATHWDAMNWTPESLEKKGLRDVQKMLEGTLDRKIVRQHVYFTNNGEKRAETPYALRESSIFEDIQYKDITEKELAFFNLSSLGAREVYNNIILIGPKGYQFYFHYHEAALLAEFYGEKLVFLAEPHTDFETMDKLINEADRICKDPCREDYDIFSDTNNNYSPFFQVTLKPGDILYIPSRWKHRVDYLTPCIGSVQGIETSALF